MAPESTYNAQQFVQEAFGSANVSMGLIMPETILALTAAVLLIWDLLCLRSGPLPGRGRRNFSFVLISIIGIGIAYLFSRSALLGEGFGRTVIRDGLGVVFERIFLLSGLLCVLISKRFLDRHLVHQVEYYILVLLATAGMIVMGKAGDMITLFLGLELLSISLYVLTGLFRGEPFSVEASFKYFILGAFSTGFLVFGIAFLYGTFGTTNLLAIGEAFRADPELIYDPYLLFFGIALILTGLGFKVSLVPFHAWAPDVYQGAPTPISGLIATGSKIAGFAALIRILALALPLSYTVWSSAIWWLALLTMIVGNFMALTQDDLKRLLAYSSVAHGGYLMMGFLSQSAVGIQAVVFYALAYTLMTSGAFAVIVLAGRHDRERYTISDMNGLADASPTLAAAMAVFLFSLAGMPVTAGFMGKLFLFAGAVQAGYKGLAIIGILTSVVSFAYYLRIVVAMYMREADEPWRLEGATASGSLAVLIAVAGVLYFGCFPGGLWGRIASSLSEAAPYLMSVTMGLGGLGG